MFARFCSRRGAKRRRRPRDRCSSPPRSERFGGLGLQCAEHIARATYRAVADALPALRARVRMPLDVLLS